MDLYSRHYKDSTIVNAPPKEVFAYIDDHERFSSHMSKSSWMMGGGRMDTILDDGKGQKVDSHIRLKGKVFGVTVFLDEVVSVHEPPNKKTWETVGDLRLYVIGPYRMTVELEARDDAHTHLQVSIEYDLPDNHAWLWQLFGRFYAKWCVRQMINGVRDYFVSLQRG